TGRRTRYRRPGGRGSPPRQSAVRHPDRRGGGARGVLPEAGRHAEEVLAGLALLPLLGGHAASEIDPVDRDQAHAPFQRRPGLPALRVSDRRRVHPQEVHPVAHERARRLAHLAARARDRQEDFAQKDHQREDEGEHRGDEEQPDELRQIDVDERVDEGDRNQQSDEKRANHREHDRAVDEAHAPAEEIEFRARRLLSLGLELAQPFLECAAAVHGAAQAIGEHSDDRPHRGEQEHRRDRELDESCDVDDVFGVHAGPLLPAAVPYTISYTIPYTIALRSWCLKWWMWLSATFSLPRSFAASASSRFFCHSPILVLIAVLSTPLTSWCTC